MPNRVSLESFKRRRGYALIAAFIVSTFVETLVHWRTPPDVLFMSTLAVSMYLLYEGTLFLIQFFRKR